MVDLEWEIREVARELSKLYRLLEEMKHVPMKPPEVRTMQNTGGNPAMPGNWMWMSRGISMSQKLQEIAFNAFGDLGKKIKDADSGTLPLLELIALNAQPISELGWASDFLDELNDQARTIGKWLHPPEPATIARAPEKYIDIEAIVRNLHQRGHHVTPRQAREVAVYNKFDLCKFTDGRNGYRLTDFLDHYTR